MTFIVLLLIALTACTHAPKSFQASDLGKYKYSERVTDPCNEPRHTRCIVQKLIYENGHVLMRQDGSVVSVEKN